MEKALAPEEARRFYDRFGARQDRQAFYEDRALDDLAARAELSGARAVFELGCGTGRFAERLLREELPAGCRYVAADVSSTMVGLARERLERSGARARVWLTDGRARVDAEDGSFDRFLSTYVFDLLSEEDIRAFLDEAHRVLAPGGLIGAAGLTEGATRPARAVTWLWKRVHRVSPRLVGGCRPLSLADRLDGDSRWEITHRALHTAYVLTSEVVVARKL